MLVFDQLRKNDTQLQLLAAAICVGFAILLAGLWWVQVVSASRYRESLETQSLKTVRVPAARGKIFDRNGVVLAENKPSYNVNLYLEDLRTAFQNEYKRSRPRLVVTNDLPFWKEWLGFSKVQTNSIKLTRSQIAALQRDSRYRVVSDVAARLGTIVNSPQALDYTNFASHFENSPAMPYPLVSNLPPAKLACYAEQAFTLPGVDLEVQPQRYYPYSNLTAHVLGYVERRSESASNEVAYYDYRLQDFKGAVGIEGALDLQLRGTAGEKAVTVNNLGFRQTETVVTPPEPGRNVFLTLDLKIQAAAEAALRLHAASGKGAVVVMDVRTGDVLAMVSLPSFDPNWKIRGFPPGALDRWNDEDLSVRVNRASSARYQAGSVFKTVVALAALEAPESHFNPTEKYRVEANPRNTARGIIYVGNQPFHDTVGPGDYDLQRAIALSSNSYFISTGLRPGVFRHVVEIAQHLHLGERIGLPLMQEIRGDFPTAEQVRKWPDGQRANICIGQGEMSVTPAQVAVLIGAIANGGTVLKPRLVDRLESQDPAGVEPPEVFSRGQIRDRLPVTKQNLTRLREAMLSETESDEGTGRRVQGCGFRVCGKTGTAERTDRGVEKNTVWFASFAPYESPRYAVVVAVENGQSGGFTCVPVARDIYLALSANDAAYTGRNGTASTR